jgi:hypothetical protein
MTRSRDEENTRWEKLEKSLDALFTRMDGLSNAQNQMKAQMDLRDQAMDSYTEEQHKIARTVEANALAIARATLGKPEKAPVDEGPQNFDSGPVFDEDDMCSILFGQEQGFEIPFAGQQKPEKGKAFKHLKTDHTASGSGKQDYNNKGPNQEQRLPKSIMPKMDFPDFYGTDPKIWLDDYKDYFDMYNIPEGMWITAAKVHLKGNAGRWYQAFKQNHSFKSWTQFCYEVEKQFGSEDYSSYMDQLLDLRQITTVEDYTTAF